VPRPDHQSDDLGLKVLDEPAASQSDATVLELQLRAMSKKTHGGDVTVSAATRGQHGQGFFDTWKREELQGAIVD
jgi:intraflagellar transport protein 46